MKKTASESNPSKFHKRVAALSAYGGAAILIVLAIGLPYARSGGTAQGYGTIYVVDIAKVTFFGIEKGGYEVRSCVFE